jgi:hypothetical protein
LHLGVSGVQWSAAQVESDTQIMRRVAVYFFGADILPIMSRCIDISRSMRVR